METEEIGVEGGMDGREGRDRKGGDGRGMESQVGIKGEGRERLE